MTQHHELHEWVAEMARICEPDRVVWIDGSEEEKENLTREAIASGEVLQLNQRKLPGCLYHRTAPNDVARTEELTFICTRLQEDAGPTNNWMSPEEGYRRAGSVRMGSDIAPHCRGGGPAPVHAAASHSRPDRTATTMRNHPTTVTARRLAVGETMAVSSVDAALQPLTKTAKMKPKMHILLIFRK